jgi:glycosyltransferase involved in cell wall biosynthesis
MVPEPGWGSTYLAGWRRVVQWRRYRFPEHLIAISENTRRDLIRELGIAPDRISVVHHGVDTAHFHARGGGDEAVATRRRHDLPEKWIICVSSDHYRKNHRVLLDAWFRVADQIDEGLVLVGRALYEDTFATMLTEVRDRGLATRFRWLDTITDAELPALYRGATVCVAPSRYEGFGMTLLEAMGCGTPVLASRNGAYDEVGGGAVLLFPVDGVATLAALLMKVTSDPALRADLVERGRRRSEAMTWASTARQTREVYRRVLFATPR